jgi:hypothetical protein
VYPFDKCRFKFANVIKQTILEQRTKNVTVTKRHSLVKKDLNTFFDQSLFKWQKNLNTFVIKVYSCGRALAFSSQG